MISSLAAAASPASTDANGEACLPRDTSPPASRAVRLQDIPSPPDHPRKDVRPMSGWASGRSAPHCQDVSEVRFPKQDQHRFCHQGDRPQAARIVSHSTHHWQRLPQAVRCGLRLHPTVKVPPNPRAMPPINPVGSEPNLIPSLGQRDPAPVQRLRTVAAQGVSLGLHLDRPDGLRQPSPDQCAGLPKGVKPFQFINFFVTH